MKIYENIFDISYGSNYSIFRGSNPDWQRESIMTKVTINDIAKASGVSIATVSRVLNRSCNVSEEIEKRVLKAVEEMDYKMPSSHKNRRSKKLVAVILPRLSNPFYNDILDGIQDTAAHSHYSMIVTQSKSEYDFRGSTAYFLRSHIMDGLITLEHANWIRSVATMIDPDLPVVQCCEYDDTLPYPFVAIDDYKAAFNAVSYLYSTGRRRIALFNSTTLSLYGRKREQGYIDALATQGIALDVQLIYHLGTIDFHVAFSAAHELFTSNKRPDAIFAVSDVYAVATTRAAQRLGVRIPRDVAVVGFDDITLALMNDPPLTTVSQPRYDIGRTACTTLLNIIEKRQTPSSGIFLESELIVRGTT